MDPDATLLLIEESMGDSELCLFLYRWIKRGGFAPDWARRTRGTTYFVRWLCERLTMESS